jgi:hypothetical protein
MKSETVETETRGAVASTALLCVPIRLKTWPVYFHALWSSEKTFEVRKDDRDYKVGDRLILQEYDPRAECYLDREIHADVTYKMPGGRWGIAEEYCVMALRITKKRWTQTHNAKLTDAGTKTL